MAKSTRSARIIRSLIIVASLLTASVMVATVGSGWLTSSTSVYAKDKKSRSRQGNSVLDRRSSRSSYVVLGYNDLGMHCMNQDFSELCLLPPYNTVHAQVIRRGEEPELVTSGVTVNYRIPGNTNSTLKTNFWTFAPALFGANLKPNIGLTGSGLAGQFKSGGKGDWIVTGIPITPILDTGELNPYQLATIDVSLNKRTLATTKTVVPVSWEISCNICHNTPGISVATDILRHHDRLHPTMPNGTPIHLEASKPVLCAKCHADPALAATGVAGVSTLSRAIHHSHASRMAPAESLLGKNTCYACHPGVNTQCQRDIHIAKGIGCVDCHGDIAKVGAAGRTPWVTEPTCGSCHSKRKPKFQFEEPGKLFKESRGHGGVHCATCHGSPHAITPTVTDADNTQAVMHQGFPGVIKKCTVCHTSTPHDPFPHKLFGEGVDD